MTNFQNTNQPVVFHIDSHLGYRVTTYSTETSARALAADLAQRDHCTTYYVNTSDGTRVATYKYQA
jgi:hypothetical protein